ncbi:MAG: hydrogenase expression protein, partial [Halorubrum sp.]
LATFGSGALLAAVPPERVGSALDALDVAGIEGAEIGAVEAPEGDEEAAGTVRIDGEPLTDPPRDELYPLWEARDAGE